MKKILYIDMDNVLVDFSSAVSRLPIKVLKEYEGRYDEVPSIFALMQPIPGAVEAFGTLAQVFDVYILTTAPWNNPTAWSDKLLWVKRYFPNTAYKRLIITHHKNLNTGDYLIDDRKNNGAGDFSGNLLLFGSNDYPDWVTIVNYLLSVETNR